MPTTTIKRMEPAEGVSRRNMLLTGSSLLLSQGRIRLLSSHSRSSNNPPRRLVSASTPFVRISSRKWRPPFRNSPEPSKHRPPVRTVLEVTRYLRPWTVASVMLLRSPQGLADPFGYSRVEIVTLPDGTYFQSGAWYP